MAEQTDQPKPVSDPNGVVASGDMTKKRRWHRKKKPAKVMPGAKNMVAGDVKARGKWLQPKKLAILLVIILLLSIGGAFLWQRTHPAAPSGPVLEFDGPEAVIVLEVTTAAKNGNPQAGIKTIEEYLQSGKAKKKRVQAYLYGNLAQLQFQANDKQGATASLNKAIELGSNDPRYYAQLGDIYLINGDLSRAGELYRKALEVYDTGPPRGYQGPDRDYYVRLAETREKQ